MRKSVRKVTLTGLVLFFFGMWGASFLPGSPIAPVLFLSLTAGKPFTVRQISTTHSRAKWQTFVAINYPDGQKTLVFFEDSPSPLVFPQDGINRKRAEEAVKKLTGKGVHGTYLVHKGSKLYWRVFSNSTRYYYDVNVTTGKVEERGAL